MVSPIVGANTYAVQPQPATRRQGNTIPAAPQFSAPSAMGHLLYGATVGFAGNTLKGLVQNWPLALAVGGLSVLVPPVGVGLLALGAVGSAVQGLRALGASNQYRRAARQSAESNNPNLAAAYYQHSQQLYRNIGQAMSNGALSMFGLKTLAGQSATRAGVDLSGRGATLRENINSLKRPSEWMAFPQRTGQWLRERFQGFQKPTFSKEALQAQADQFKSALPGQVAAARQQLQNPAVQAHLQRGAVSTVPVITYFDPVQMNPAQEQQAAQAPMGTYSPSGQVTTTQSVSQTMFDFRAPVDPQMYEALIQQSQGFAQVFKPNNA
jgi:hypothetical protein